MSRHGYKSRRAGQRQSWLVSAIEFHITARMSIAPCPVWLRGEALRRLRAGVADTTNTTATGARR